MTKVHLPIELSDEAIVCVLRRSAHDTILPSIFRELRTFAESYFDNGKAVNTNNTVMRLSVLNLIDEIRALEKLNRVIVYFGGKEVDAWDYREP